jgi:hypothetical protein
MTRRNWLLLVVLAVVLGLVAIVNYSRQQPVTPTPATTDYDRAFTDSYKSAFVENCLRQANAVALQQSKAFNEEQKRVLQQVCGCGADRTIEKFTKDELKTFSENLNDPVMLGRMKEIMQNCATETKMPASNP